MSKTKKVSSEETSQPPRDNNEVNAKEAFCRYLKRINEHTQTWKNRDGVDVVAFINGRKTYFELKTTEKIWNKEQTLPYFGAMSQVEWECALAHPKDFYIVFVQGKVGEFKFKIVRPAQILENLTLEPFATYINIVFQRNEFIDMSSSREFDFPNDVIAHNDSFCNENLFFKMSDYYNCLKIKAESAKKLKKSNELENSKTEEFKYCVVPSDDVDNWLEKGRKVSPNEMYDIEKLESAIKRFSNDSKEEWLSIIRLSKKQLESRKKVRISKKNVFMSYYHVSKKDSI